MKALFLVGMLFSLAALGQTQSPTWEAARAAIENDFARGDHGKLVQLSGPDRRELGLITVRWHGTALVQRADGTRWRERVLAEYKLVGDVWELARVHVYESTALADVEAPRKEQAESLFMAAWKDRCEGYDIQGVTLDGEPRFQRETTNEPNPKRWYVYRVKVAAKGNGKFRLSEDGASYENVAQNLLLWNPADKSWSVEQRQLRCSFTKLR
ncbi:MAG TPA: hypothetical protein VD965_14230 [Burkholderiales bacterium]|nr:hypothetical protein [Burkholderiales bacterium]